MKSTSPIFTGFAKESLTFLSKVKEENSKDWYDKNKASYNKTLLEPFQSLVVSLSPTIQEIDPTIEIRPDIGKTISRIYRDTRFSKDKSRYRDRIWLVFKRPQKEWIDSPVYFFEIRPHSFYYGLGYYAASRDTMDRVREHILNKEQTFLQATRPLLSQFELSGESYKRSLKPDLPNEIATWYNRKSFSVMVENPNISDLFNKQLVTTLRDAFVLLAPLYAFLVNVEEEKRAAASHLHHLTR
ncbi:DUF2461 domain-containing protein [Pectobacterium brasiliense]|uniref:DUF2461 domain-containing protein n=1 Tax=Pectobacterium brasiliense TaxID=180957 RepID=UPI00202DA347|nr:DUF2461 domain-containing protein [Pectobacterium brasiliense]MCL6376836.1 DUF2461 domain-containing protein [Pectobacterium brasiliense]